MYLQFLENIGVISFELDCDSVIVSVGSRFPYARFQNHDRCMQLYRCQLQTLTSKILCAKLTITAFFRNLLFKSTYFYFEFLDFCIKCISFCFEM